MQKCLVHLGKSIIHLYFFYRFLVAVEDPTLQEMAEYMEVNRLENICCGSIIFIFGLNSILFLGMVMYDNDFERKTRINRNKKMAATYI